ncbi:hypothetical protein PAXRUDRAFT_550218 [Paxillus rubicundulus Ve08.2h10]|uniref:Uncharacterized protein n=1 Tax=Paxillus rubicundulus Ve08.2h10 TaxID=930991 RepID=A0A0D0BS93_9AGAM|nr:hypothetical protein PAXRUDRAFT_550218 [Paxillus rubicundulus Ve08.2h10]
MNIIIFNMPPTQSPSQPEGYVTFALSRSSIIVSGRTRWPRYFFAAQAARFPFKLL